MKVPGRKIILASSSPQRVTLLRDAGVAIEIQPADVDEESIVGSDATETAWWRARAKARKVADSYAGHFVLGADTVVENSSGQLLGKPENNEEASDMFRALLGTRHRVISAAVIVVEGAEHKFVGEAWVSLKSPTEEEIQNYLNTGESIGKAGGLCVQGQGRIFVEKIEGEMAAVVGLPLNRIMDFLFAQNEVI